MAREGKATARRGLVSGNNAILKTNANKGNERVQSKQS